MDSIEGTLKKYDYSQEVTETSKTGRKLIEQNKFPEALQNLINLEKKCRIVNDSESTARLLVEIACIHRLTNQWEPLCEIIRTMSRKRGQFKLAQHSLIKEGFEYVNLTPNTTMKIKLIETLLFVSEGKIFAEIERARLTMMLSEIKESMGDIEGACKVLIGVQVETFTSMETREMTQFILHQMRLCIAFKDFNRASIIGRKINLKSLDGLNQDNSEFKLTFYNYMVLIEVKALNYLEVSKYYLSILDTISAQDWKPILANAVNYVILSPYSHKQVDLLHRINNIRRLESLPQYKEILGDFIEAEIIGSEQFFIKYFDVLCNSPLSSNVFGLSLGESKSRLEELKTRIIEHNVSVIAKSYSCITIFRAAQLLQLTEEETEKHLSKLVVEGVTWARIDRMKSVVNFRPVETNEETLDRLCSSTGNLMMNVSKVVHLINKETMRVGGH